MTGLDWRKANWPCPDPGRAIDVGPAMPSDTMATDLASKQSARKRAAAKRLAARRRQKQRDVKGVQSVAAAWTIVPLRRARLIASILRDLGYQLPKRRNRFNALLMRLIEDEAITVEGGINKRHPLIRKWLDKIVRENNN